MGLDRLNAASFRNAEAAVQILVRVEHELLLAEGDLVELANAATDSQIAAQMDGLTMSVRGARHRVEGLIAEWRMRD